MKAAFKVQGMTCGGCERSVENALNKHPGVQSAEADRASETVSMEFDPALIDRATLAKAIAEAGFHVSPDGASS